MNKYLLELSKQTIETESTSHLSSHPLAEYFANHLEDVGLKVQLISDEIDGVLKTQIVAHAGPSVEGGLLFSGHMDTVPFADQPGWTRNALKFEIADDKVFGRGSCDMKLFIAQCIAAFKELDLSQLKRPLVCYFTCDEEWVCQGAGRLAPKLADITPVPLPSRAIIGEPTDFEIIHAHRGFAQFKLKVFGKPGHSSKPDIGENAIETLGRVIGLIDQLNGEFRKNVPEEVLAKFPDFPYNHFHMAIAQSGLATNMIPELAELTISYRPLPGDDAHQLLDLLKSRLEQNELGGKFKVEHFIAAPAMDTSRDEELTTLLKKLTGNQTLKSVPYATDGGHLKQVGIECFVCGPGSLSMAHQPDEYMPLEHFTRGPELVKNIVQQFLF